MSKPDMIVRRRSKLKGRTQLATYVSMPDIAGRYLRSTFRIHFLSLYAGSTTRHVSVPHTAERVCGQIGLYGTLRQCRTSHSRCRTEGPLTRIYPFPVFLCYHSRLTILVRTGQLVAGVQHNGRDFTRLKRASIRPTLHRRRRRAAVARRVRV